MKPMIKYAGGKSGEIEVINSFRNLVENILNLFLVVVPYIFRLNLKKPLLMILIQGLWNSIRE